MKVLLRRIWLLGLFTAFIHCAPALTLTNQAGSEIEVEILQIEAKRIQLRMANGQETWYARELLSDASQAAIAELESDESERFLELNQLLGIPLFADALLWDDAPAAVAERLRWPPESKTKTQSSYRFYPMQDYRILASRPYSAVLYGEDSRTLLISLVFANKGDFKFDRVISDEQIEAMQEAIERDAETIEEQLTQELGTPDRQQFGSGRGIKQIIQRWNWKEHAFLLASQEGEYVSLKIMSSEAADNKGRGERISDAKLRELTTDNIITRSNGDVLISNIPMVDQGPKGYCVPATFERYLRYMQIPADMYLLAMAGQTQIGGGTSLSQIIESIDDYISSQSRSMKELRETIKVRTVQKYIDRGLPIIWTMYSTPQYNEYSNQRTLARQSVKEWQQWADEIKTEARDLELRKDIMTGHACLIIGYNKDTDEIAVSDSWGPSYRERWISAEQAEQVSQGSIYLISY